MPRLRLPLPAGSRRLPDRFDATLVAFASLACIALGANAWRNVDRERDRLLDLARVQVEQAARGLADRIDADLQAGAAGIRVPGDAARAVVRPSGTPRADTWRAWLSAQAGPGDTIVLARADAGAILRHAPVAGAERVDPRGHLPSAAVPGSPRHGFVRAGVDGGEDAPRSVAWRRLESAPLVLQVSRDERLVLAPLRQSRVVEGAIALAGMLGVSLATAGLLRHARRLREREAFGRAVIEASPGATLVVDRLGWIVMANARASLLFGWQHDELVGMPIERLLPASLRERHASHIERYFERPRSRRMAEGRPLVAMARDGREVPVAVSLMPVSRPGRELVLVSFSGLPANAGDGHVGGDAEARARGEADALLASLRPGVPVGIAG